MNSASDLVMKMGYSEFQVKKAMNALNSKFADELIAWIRKHEPDESKEPGQPKQAHRSSRAGEKDSAIATVKPTTDSVHVGSKIGQCKLQIRLMNSENLMHAFNETEPLAAVRAFVERNRSDGNDAFNLMTCFPKKVFTDEEMEMSLSALGLSPSSTLILARKDQVEEARIRLQIRNIADERRQVADKELREYTAERKRQEKLDNEAKQQVLEQIKGDKEVRRELSQKKTLKQSSAKKPAAASVKTVDPCTLQIRLTDGRYLEHTFNATDLLEDVRFFIVRNRSDGSEDFNLMMCFPKKVFTNEEMMMTLSALGLAPSSILVINKKCEANEERILLHIRDTRQERRRIDDKAFVEYTAERKKQMKLEQEAKRRVLDEIEGDKEARARASQGKTQKIPEPSTTKPAIRNYKLCKLQIRLENGEKLEGTFEANWPLSAVRLFVEKNLSGSGYKDFNLMTAFPNRVFTREEMDESLLSLGLVPSSVLVVRQNNFY